MERTILWNGTYRTITVDIIGEDEEANIKSATCVHCGEVFDFAYDDDWEQELWTHLSYEHEDIHEEIQDYNTPEMLEECYIVYEEAE